MVKRATPNHNNHGPFRAMRTLDNFIYLNCSCPTASCVYCSGLEMLCPLSEWCVSSLPLEGIWSPLLLVPFSEASLKQAASGGQLWQSSLLSRNGTTFQRPNSQGSPKRVMQTSLALEFKLGKLRMKPSNAALCQTQFEAIYHQQFWDSFSTTFFFCSGLRFKVLNFLKRREPFTVESGRPRVCSNVAFSSHAADFP